MNSNPLNLPPHSNIKGTPPWGLWEVFFAFIAGFIIAPGLMYLILKALYPQAPKWSQLLLTHMATYAFWIRIFWGLGKRYGSQALEYLGLKQERSTAYYLVASLLCAGGIFAIGWALGALAQQFDWPYPQPYEVFQKDQLKLIALLAVLAAPFLEEITFRGFLQISLAKYLPAGGAIILTALIFTLFHSLYYHHWMAMVYVFLLGLLLGTVRYVTGSTIPCIFGHLMNNAMAALILMDLPQ